MVGARKGVTDAVLLAAGSLCPGSPTHHTRHPKHATHVIKTRLSFSIRFHYLRNSQQLSLALEELSNKSIRWLFIELATLVTEV